MVAKKESIWVSVEYKGVTTPRNFISLVSPFFSHLGIWSLEKVIWSSQRTSINLTKWHGRYFHVWQDDDDEFDDEFDDETRSISETGVEVYNR